MRNKQHGENLDFEANATQGFDWGGTDSFKIKSLQSSLLFPPKLIPFRQNMSELVQAALISSCFHGLSLTLTSYGVVSSQRKGRG